MTSKASIRFIFCTVLIDMIGLGLVIPILPDIIRRFSDDPAFISRYYGYFMSVYALMQFFASPVLGTLSDRFGRRPILLVSLMGAGLDYLLMAWSPNLWILFIGRIISGLTGASMTVASSYIADVSEDSNRSANFGMIGAAFGIGFIIGPLIGGLLGSLGPAIPFIGAAFLNMVNFAFGYFVLPESLPAASRRNIQIGKLNPFESVWQVLKPSPITAFIWVYVLLCLAGQVHPSNWTIYTETKFGWSSFQVGLSLMAVGIMFSFSQGYMTKILIRKFGEIRCLYIGMLVSAFAFALFAFATHGWMMYAIMLTFVFSGVTNPALQSLISKTKASNEQGELQGTLIALASLTAIAGPLLYTWLFAVCTEKGAPVYFPGVAYLTAALVCVAGFAVFFLFRSSEVLHDAKKEFASDGVVGAVEPVRDGDRINVVGDIEDIR